MVQTQETVETCPDCHGRGEITGTEWPNGRVIRRDCQFCKATGKVWQRSLEWRRIGEQMRADRERRDRSLREEARERGMSPVALGDMERGYIAPRPR